VFLLVQYPLHFLAQRSSVLTLNAKLPHLIIQGLTHNVYVCVRVKDSEASVVSLYETLILRRDSLSIREQLQYIA
jgi:hypothetical protein